MELERPGQITGEGVARSPEHRHVCGPGTSQWQTAHLDPPCKGLGPEESVQLLHPESMVPLASGGGWLVTSQTVKGPLLLSVESNRLEVRR